MFWIYFGISPAASHYHRIEENIWTGWSAFLKNGYNWEIFLISSGSSAGQLYLLVPNIWMSPVLMWKHLGNTFLTFFILWKCLGNIVYLLSIGPLHVNLLKSLDNILGCDQLFTSGTKKALDDDFWYSLCVLSLQKKRGHRLLSWSLP